jgi:hypothetical protein
VIPEAEGNGERELQGESNFTTLEAADTEAFLMGKQWIDAKGSGENADVDVALP